ncbi:MAG TPA: translocation/assembly module TamB domain-containing protein [Gemmatimonadaceae bacterium]|nr:translocation/assembly module TamB domain-containing protein [Gemmatimonadaceae bacterium]
MSRRLRLVLFSAAVLMAVLVLLVAAGGVATQTDFGQERVRRFVSSWLNSRVTGSMYVGRVSGGFLGGVTVDSVEIRDDRGELFVASGRTVVRFDLRDLFDRRTMIRHLVLSNPIVQIRQYHDGSWNFRRIFPGGQPAPIGQRRGFGDFVIIDSATIAGGRVLLSLPWRPPDGLTAAAGERLLQEALADTAGRIKRTAHGPMRVYRWDQIDARIGRSRLAHPDSAGRLVNVLQLATVTSSPPFRFSDASGVVHQRGDSVWFEAPQWRLPGSEGSARGTIRWGGGRPVRYAIRIDAERASLADVEWIYPTFPRTGGGRATVDVRNAAHDESIIEYAVSNMDVTTHGSRLTGRMVVDPSDDIVAIRNLSVRAAPLDFELLRAVNGEAFPYDWRGTFTGTVAASGGRVDRFRVERADLVFADGHVRGATSAATASGVLDISEPALTVFHGLRLNVSRLDLRTPRAVIADFPQLSGEVSGTVILDSLWLDVRARGADLVHRDGDGPVSHVTGSGRITLADPYLRYDLDLFAPQLSLTTLGRSYPNLPLHGEFAGPIRVRGEAPQLSLAATLEGPGGRLIFDGVVDTDPPSYGAHGSGAFSGADLSRLLRREAPESRLNGTYEIVMSAADMNSAAGSFAVRLDSSSIGQLRLLPSFATGDLAEGLLSIDSSALALPGARIDAGGSIALTRTASASLRIGAAIDSLPAVAELLARVMDTVPQLSGELRAEGELRTGQAPGVVANVTGRQLVVGDQRAQSLRGAVDVTRGGGRLSGAISLAADTIVVRGVRFDHAEGAAQLPLQLGAEGRYHAALRMPGGGVTNVAGRLARDGDTSRVHVDTLFARVDADRAYRATSPSTIRLARGFVAMDSLILAPVSGTGSLAVRDLLWSPDSVSGVIRSRDADLGLLNGLVPGITEASGPLRIELALAGTPAQPRARGAFTLDNGRAVVSGARYERVTANVELNDTWLEVRELSAETPRGGGRRGSARAHGTVDLSDRDNPVFDLEATARSFRAVNRRGFATLDISTGPALRLVGPYRAAILSGSVIVDEGTVHLPERLDKEIASLDDETLYELADTSQVEARSLLPGAPGEFVSNLRLDDVNIVLGEDVWLRSSEANVELGGSLRVTRGLADVEDDARLALVGTLNATRGTYVLNLAVVQPTFHVERGTVRFFGTPDINPTLDIRAIHTVRQPRRAIAREDVRILAAITGNLRAPQLSLSSADGLNLSQSDLLSYLVTGEPAFALTGTSTEYAEQLLTLGGRLAGTLISARIPRSLFDIVEVQPGAVRLEAGASNVSSSYLNTLYNTRVILGKQLSDRWYVGLSTGLCRANFSEGLGLHLEYRFNSTYFAQGGIEPGSGDVACVGTTTARTFQQTPPQLGLDLFRSWRF